MPRDFPSFVTLVSLVLCSTANAQAPESIGIRAQGMGGAFTAVADDATATWWNPAGLAGGAYFSMLLEVGSQHAPRTDRDASGGPAAAWRVGTRAFALALPSLGLSYYRLRVSEMQPPGSTASAPPIRQDQGIADVSLRSLVLHQFGATIAQSVGEHLVIGSTLKLVHASLGASTRPRGSASLDEAEALAGAGETHAGLDMGAMVTFGRARFGLAVQNLSQPEFGSGVDAIKLKRHARTGAALTTGTRGAIGSATLAVDADQTKTATALGDERRLAAGVEAWTTKRLGLRGGVSASTVGPSRVSLSGGVSAAFRPGAYIDVQRTGGPEESRHGWGVAVRVTF